MSALEVANDGTRLVVVYRALEAMHAWRGWHWWPDADPFEVIVGSILVQNTMWTNVERALERLKAAAALTPDAMSRLSLEDLEELVRASGQYRQKARKLQAFLALVEAYGGLDAVLRLPADELRRVLLGTWGIGEETADSIVAYASRQPAFVIDAYTRRLFSRLGLGPVETDHYGRWQAYFLANLQDVVEDPWDTRDFWARYHALIVMHCKYLCLKRAPRCGECRLAPVCPASGVAVGQ